MTLDGTNDGTTFDGSEWSQTFNNVLGNKKESPSDKAALQELVDPRSKVCFKLYPASWDYKSTLKHNENWAFTMKYLSM